jgi:hypothetical protein
VADRAPIAFISGAREYKQAADELADFRATSGDAPGQAPVYFLYFHTIELALKGVCKWSAGGARI